MSKRSEQMAKEAYPKSDFDGVETRRKGNRKCFIQGYEQAEKDIISIIESRLSELLGDAQPTPALRAELQDLIKKIKEDKK